MCRPVLAVLLGAHGCGNTRVDLGEVAIDAAGLLVLAYGLVGLAKQIVSLEVIAVNGNQLLEGCDRFFDLLRIEVVAGNDHLVLGGILRIPQLQAETNNLA